MNSFQRRQLYLLFTTLITLAVAQDYQEYNEFADGYANQDNLYADYAMKQQDKTVGDGGGPGVGKMLILGGIGWVAGGTYHSRKAKKTLQKKQLVEAKTLYSQYYNDVYKLQEQNAELVDVVHQLQSALKQAEEKKEQDALQRDYDEFKQPDVDGDDRISRAEFNMYVKNYLSSYPGLAEKDYPRFEEFDHDRDGYVSFAEYNKQMKLQAKKAEQDALRAQQSGSQNAAQKAGLKAAAYSGLSGNTRQADSFDDLYAQYALR
mmetsp:Transcript_1639/g.2169  ORF Transcript_1639/g.2169 Transcript_1639/m.2169 type:complete len:262 (+) Transcript_1639:75-860(+)